VDHDTEAGVEQHEPGRTQAVPLRGRRGPVKYIKPQREREVGDHRQPIRDRQAGEDTVGSRDHVLAREDDDVEDVGDDSKEADYGRYVSVPVAVPLVARLEVSCTGVHERLHPAVLAVTGSVRKFCHSLHGPEGGIAAVRSLRVVSQQFGA